MTDVKTAEAGRYSREILELSQALEALWEIAEGLELEGVMAAISRRLHVLLGVTDGTDKDTE